ncbi:MAG: ABC transporter ATP-binding protein [Actinobacteria bacterium]|nr:ABC transporter ATP-binding protein [Actinomycetota bacterium]
MDTVVSTDRLTKAFGDVLAVDRLSLEVGAGEIYGFLGLNGAGKTTTIRMLLGMIRPTGGSADVFGNTVGPNAHELWSRVGYLVEMPYSYPQLTVKENLEVIRRLRLMDDPNAVDRVMDLMALTKYADRRTRTLSQGNEQRLGIARAIIHEPELLILDEPANGLDPAGVVEIRELLKRLSRERGVTVFMSSHILAEVARLATRIGIIHEGRLLEEFDSDQLDARLRPRLHIDSRDREAARLVLESKGFRPVTVGDGILELASEDAINNPDRIARLLVESGQPPTLLQVRQQDLETHFLQMVNASGDEQNERV